MIIHLYKKNVYGNTLIYPTGNCAIHLCKLLGKKTLSITDINCLGALGHEIQFVKEPPCTSNLHPVMEESLRGIFPL